MKDREERKKKGYLIAKALHQFMWASILASLASQIAMTTDAIVVSQFIGSEDNLGNQPDHACRHLLQFPDDALRYGWFRAGRQVAW